jgi:hypothetical protein
VPDICFGWRDRIASCEKIHRQIGGCIGHLPLDNINTIQSHLILVKEKLESSVILIYLSKGLTRDWI